MSVWCFTVQCDVFLDVCSVLCLCLFACVWIIIPLSAAPAAAVLETFNWVTLLWGCCPGADQSIKYNQCNVWSVSSDTDNTDTDTHQYIHTTLASVKARAGNEPSRSFEVWPSQLQTSRGFVFSSNIWTLEWNFCHDPPWPRVPGWWSLVADEEMKVQQRLTFNKPTSKRYSPAPPYPPLPLPSTQNRCRGLNEISQKFLHYFECVLRHFAKTGFYIWYLSPSKIAMSKIRWGMRVTITIDPAHNKTFWWRLECCTVA